MKTKERIAGLLQALLDEIRGLRSDVGALRAFAEQSDDMDRRLREVVHPEDAPDPAETSLHVEREVGPSLLEAAKAVIDFFKSPNTAPSFEFSHFINALRAAVEREPDRLVRIVTAAARAAEARAEKAEAEVAGHVKALMESDAARDALLRRAEKAEASVKAYRKRLGEMQTDWLDQGARAEKAERELDSRTRLLDAEIRRTTAMRALLDEAQQNCATFCGENERLKRERDEAAKERVKFHADATEARKERDAAIEREKALRDVIRRSLDVVRAFAFAEPINLAVVQRYRDDAAALLRSPPKPVRGPDVRKEVEG